MRSRVLTSTVGTLGLTVSNRALALAVAAVLSNLLGAKGYGTYAYALSWLMLLAVVATLGFEKLLVREVVRLRGGERWDLLAGLFRFAGRRTFLLSSLFLLVGLGWISWRFRVASDPVAWTYLLMLACLPLLALTRIRQGAMQGLRKVVWGNVPELLLRPLLLLVVIGLIFVASGQPAFRAGEYLSPHWAAVANVTATLLAFIVGTLLLRRFLPPELAAAAPSFESKQWLSNSLPMAFIGTMYILNRSTDVLMLGFLEGHEEVGIYAIASRGSALVLLVLMAVNKAIGPELARHHAQGEKQRLQVLVTKSTWGIFLLSLFAVLVLVVGGRFFLSIFGRDFGAGYWALVILCLGRLVNAAAGSVGLLLLMTGHEKAAAQNVGACVVLNIVLNAFLIPRYGLEGAAVATGISGIGVNALQAYVVLRRVGVRPTILGGWPTLRGGPRDSREGDT